MTGRLDGKVGLITGSDSGIGQASAAEFAKEGADVIVHFLHDEEGARATSKAVEAEGRRAVVVRADIRSEVEVASMFAAVRHRPGRLHPAGHHPGQPLVEPPRTRRHPAGSW